MLVAQGVKKGDRVIIYMPMVPEAIVAMLACARIGPSPVPSPNQQSHPMPRPTAPIPRPTAGPV